MKLLERSPVSVENNTQAAVSRRTLARGAAWAAPAIAATAAVPAYAASRCTPELSQYGGIEVQWGTLDSRYQTSRSLYLSAGTKVTNIPENVTVTKVVHHWYIQASASDGSAPGLPWIGDSKSSRAREAQRNVINHTPGSTGWSRIVTTSTSSVSREYQGFQNWDGNSYNFWDLTFTWEPVNGSKGNYTTDSAGCRSFDTGDSGTLFVQYTRLPSLTSNQCSSEIDGHLRYVNEMTVHFSDGTTKTTRLWAKRGITCANSMGW